jgi:hypothetical protein
VCATATATTDYQNIKSGYTNWNNPVAGSGLLEFFDSKVAGFILVCVATIV